MSPSRSDNDAINRRYRDGDPRDAARDALGLGFMSMSMRSSTLNLNGRPPDADADAGFIDPEDSRRRNSSEANGMASATGFEVVAPNGNGQEVELRDGDDSVSGGGLSINRQFDSSSSDAPSLPSNGVADANHCQDWRKGWGICKPNWGSLVKAVGVGVVVACVYAIINNNMKKNALISDLQTENSLLKNKEQQYLLDISQLGSEQAQQQQGGGKKSKANKDDCCACLPTSSVRFLSIYPLRFLCLCEQCKPQLIFSTILILLTCFVHVETAIDKLVSL